MTVVSKRMTIALDFDGVIHKYSKGYQDGSIYDAPVEKAFIFINKLLHGGHSVFIFSSRDSRQIKDWMDRFSFIPTEIVPPGQKFWNKQHVVGITNTKLVAHLYIDDRAITFKGDFSKTLVDIQNFKPWNNVKNSKRKGIISVIRKIFGSSIQEAESKTKND